MTTSACGQEDDAMQHAARFSPHHSQQLCRWYARSGTCRTKGCKLSHVKAADTGVAAQASYDDRLWTLSSTEDDKSQPGQQSWRFSVASYNILADKYARHYRSYLYHDVPATYLDWHHRRSAILAELAYLLPDVICLQEVDRYEDLESELEQLGYSGIYLQRDGGRRDGCATFWRHSLLRPAVVRQVRFSHHDLKDNVALLVLFEPCHSTAQHGALSSSAAAAAEAAAGADGMPQQQQQHYGETLEQLEQQQQQQYGQSPQPGGVLSHWLPKGWLWSNSSNSSSSHHARSSQLLLRPVHPSHTDVAGSSPGCVYQVPVQLQQQQQQQAGCSRSSFEAAAGAAAGASYASHGSSGRGHKKGQRRNSSGSRRNSLERHMQGAGKGDTYSAAASQQQQQEGQVPDWVRCALLVANTHIIFTPEKGEVKLGQARLLVQEVGQMAQWYLEQQQQQQQQQGVVSAANDSATSSSMDTTPAAAAAAEGADDDGVCGAVAPANTKAVAAILTGDYNATPNSPLYAYMSKGVLDLQTVNKRNVSHMVGGSHHHHHKGYRGFRRANRRKSVELQQQQQQQQQGEAMAAAGYQLQQQQQGLQPVPTTVAAADGTAARIQSGPFAASENGVSDTAAATVPVAEQQGSSSWRASPGPALPTNSSNSSGQVANGAVSIPVSSSSIQRQNSSSIQRQNSSGSAPSGSSPPAAAGSPQRQNSLGQKQYRWSDREVRRAAGMSYDELVEASMSYLSESDNDSPLASSDDSITRAAAAFAATAAAGSGAAAAATAAAAAADAPARQESASILGSSPMKAFFAAAVSRCPSGISNQPLLLQHGLNLKSSYKSVLGQEPDYTSSHSQFMDTCDYIWYTSSPLTQQQQQASNNQPDAGSSNGSSAHQPGSSSSSSSSVGGRYELRPVAVLQPPDGMKLNKGLPAKALGSDHICLLTDFKLVLKEEQ